MRSGGWPGRILFLKEILGHGLHGLRLGAHFWQLIFAFVSPILSRMMARNSTARIISVCSSFSEDGTSHSQLRRESITLAFS
jgi:hypothetical protein